MKKTTENLKKYHLKKAYRAFLDADISSITFDMELDKIWHDHIKCRADDVQLGEILDEDGPWMLGNIESMNSKLFDFQFFTDEYGDVCMQASPMTEDGHGDVLNHTFFCNIHIKLKASPECTDDIWVVDEEMFGPNEEESFTFDFYDGFAIENGCRFEENPCILLYPTLQEINADKAMQKQIEDYCSDGLFYVYNIALKFGKIFKFGDLR